ncbi:unnamed protein product [Amoebophrya sp. A25]|nr:unnamed protein product [Amoebophrya sp. A25]|eukprot:GSA25T00004234001.1
MRSTASNINVFKKFFLDGWKCADVAVAVLASIDLWPSLIFCRMFVAGKQEDHEQGYERLQCANYSAWPDAAFFLIIRFFRFLRLLRVYNRYMHLKRLIIAFFKGISHTRQFLLLLLPILVPTACAFTALVGRSATFADASTQEGQANYELWGTVPRAMLTLFQIGTMDWGDIARASIDRRPVLALFFFAYLLVVGYALANLFIGLVGDRLNEAAQYATDAEDNRPMRRFGFAEAKIRRLRHLAASLAFPPRSRISSSKDAEDGMGKMNATGTTSLALGSVEMIVNSEDDPETDAPVTTSCSSSSSGCESTSIDKSGKTLIQEEATEQHVGGSDVVPPAPRTASSIASLQRDIFIRAAKTSAAVKRTVAQVRKQLEERSKREDVLRIRAMSLDQSSTENMAPGEEMSCHRNANITNADAREASCRTTLAKKTKTLPLSHFQRVCVRFTYSVWVEQSSVFVRLLAVVLLVTIYWGDESHANGDAVTGTKEQVAALTFYDPGGFKSPMHPKFTCRIFLVLCVLWTTVVRMFTDYAAWRWVAYVKAVGEPAVTDKEKSEKVAGGREEVSDELKNVDNRAKDVEVVSPLCVSSTSTSVTEAEEPSTRDALIAHWSRLTSHLRAFSEHLYRLFWVNYLPVLALRRNSFAWVDRVLNVLGLLDVLFDAIDYGAVFYGFQLWTLLRLFRGARRFRALRALVAAFVMAAATIRDFLILFLPMVVPCSVLMTRLVGQNYQTFAVNDDAPEDELLEGQSNVQLWGNVFRSSLTLFQISTFDWGDVSRPMIEAFPMMALLVVAYILIVSFALANLFISLISQNLTEVMNSARAEGDDPALSSLQVDENEDGAPASTDDVEGNAQKPSLTDFGWNKTALAERENFLERLRDDARYLYAL